MRLARTCSGSPCSFRRSTSSSATSSFVARSRCFPHRPEGDVPARAPRGRQPDRAIATALDRFQSPGVRRMRSLPEWLAAASAAQPLCIQIGARLNRDLTSPVKAARGMAHGESPGTGEYRFRFRRTAQLPHGWDAGQAARLGNPSFHAVTYFSWRSCRDERRAAWACGPPVPQMHVRRGHLAQAALMSLPACPQKGRPRAAHCRSRGTSPGGIHVCPCGNEPDSGRQNG